MVLVRLPSPLGGKSNSANIWLAKDVNHLPVQNRLYNSTFPVDMQPKTIGIDPVAKWPVWGVSAKQYWKSYTCVSTTPSKTPRTYSGTKIRIVQHAL